jgi:proteasome lid subunit RPN8/RPN11
MKKKPRRKKSVKTKRKQENDMRDIFIESHAFKELITSAIEVYNRETNGVLLGHKTFKAIKGEKKNVVSIKNVYPFQMERRTPSEVTHGNIAAFKRVLRTIDSFEAEIVGGYHSHTPPYDVVRLSHGDIKSIKEDIEAMLKIGHRRVAKGWIEILMSIKRKEYKKPRTREWYICDYIKKLRCYLRTHEKIGYDVLLSAYWIYPKKEIEGADLRKIKFGIREVAVYVEWILD